MKRIRTLLVATLLAGPAGAPAAQHDEHAGPEEHGAHVHGSARLTAALEGSRLVIELVAPAADIVGFEHESRDGDDHRQVRRAVARLRRASELFDLPAAARCRLDTADIDSALLVDRAGGHHEPDDGAHAAEPRHTGHAEHDEGLDREAGGHTDFEVAYRFACEKPAAVDRVTVELFRHFPSLGEIDAQFVGPRGQGATELTATNNVLHLK